MIGLQFASSRDARGTVSGRQDAPEAPAGAARQRREAPTGSGTDGPDGSTAGADSASDDAVTAVAWFFGIPETDLTPAIRNALGSLLTDARRLREQVRDLTQRVDQLGRLADEDPLLTVANRRAFTRALERAAAFARRHGTPSTVLYVDVDGMKQVNDRLGHPAGDGLLRHVVQALRAEIRDTDMIGRLGGDEFGILMVGTHPDDERAAPSRLRRAVAGRPLTWSGRRIPVRVSIGAVTIDGRMEAEAALAAADSAMYESRRIRRGGI